MPEASAPPSPAALHSCRAEAAYATHYRLLRSVATQNFRIPDDEVDDVIQDVFLAFIRSEAKIRTTMADERSWLVGAICNASRYYWRKKRGGDDALPVVDEPVDPIAVADEAISRVIVADVLEQLDPRCRQVLHRRYAEGYTPEEIATSESLKRGSAKNLISKCLLAARAAFRRLLRNAS